PSFEKKALLSGAASSQVLVDSSTSAIADVEKDPAPLANRAVVLAQYMSSAEARAAIAKEMGLSPTQIAADGPFSTLTDRSTYQAVPAGPRADQLTEENAVYRLVFDAQLSLPIISIYTQAPDADGAIKLADAASSVLTGYVSDLDNGIPKGRQITVTSLGDPEGGTVNSGASPILAFLAFLATLIVLCALIVLGSGFVRQWRTDRDLHDDEAQPAEPEDEPRSPRPSDDLLRHPRLGKRPSVSVGEPRPHHR
ncbi:MAG TPA: hypothetical protein VJQ84_05600, partial [Solirubrobacterales bacterium]|nr:hypothetical protein [Solirubrobacterales bacterium]